MRVSAAMCRAEILELRLRQEADYSRQDVLPLP